MTSPLTEEAEEAARRADEKRVRAALRAASGNVTKAAAALEVPTRTLHRRIAALGLRKWLTLTYPRSKRQPKR